MADHYTLSPEELQYYEDNGYLVIRQLFDSASLHHYTQRFIDICNGINRGNLIVVKEPQLVAKGLKGENAINKINDIHFDDVFMSYTEHPKLLHVISQFIGTEIRVTNSMFINKPPGSKEHPPHQDLAYFPFRPADKIVAAWTAIDPVTAANGALYVLPGSHRGELFRHLHDPKFNKLYHGIPEPRAAPVSERLVVNMLPGDTVFFHPLLVHGSGANVSENNRKSISAHYASEECYYIDVSDDEPQAAVKEAVEAEARRRGIDLNFKEVFRYKSKPVDGMKSKL